MTSVNSNPTVLSDRDVNTSEPKTGGGEPSVVGLGLGNKKSLEYHRQMLHSKLKGEDGMPQYVSPSDGIMSPCTAKLSAYKNKHFMKAKPQSLFTKTSAKSVPSQEFADFQSVGSSRNDQTDTGGSSAESSQAGASQ